MTSHKLVWPVIVLHAVEAVPCVQWSVWVREGGGGGGGGGGGKEKFNNILTGYQIKGALQRKPRQKKCADFEILT